MAGFDPAQADQLALAVDEASTNVIEHAYGGAPGRVVEVRFDDRGQDLRVEVWTTASGWTRGPSPRSTSDATRASGARAASGSTSWAGSWTR